MKKTVWITGASSGIGEALAYEYAAKNYNVILSARSHSVLEKVKTNNKSSFVRVLLIDLEDHFSFTQKSEASQPTLRDHRWLD